MRIERGLQQSDLVGPGVSVSYLSMLENGNREPTPRVIEHLASVLGVDPLELSGPIPREQLGDEQRLQLAAAEFALTNADRDRAVAEFAALEPAFGLPASWGLARALEASGNLEQALVVLDRVSASAAAEGDHLLLVRVHIARARCLGETGEDVGALEAALDAAAAVDAFGLVGTDEHAQAMSALVGRYYMLGDLFNAETTARQLLHLVDAGSSWKARGSAYWNAAGIAEASGELSKAVSFAERAVALFSEGDDERAYARCAIACAWFWMRHPDAQTHLDAIDQLLSQASHTLANSGTDIDHAYLETEQARAALLRADPATAIHLAARALDRLGEEPRSEAATALLVLVQAQLQVDDESGAAKTADRLELTLLSLPHNRSAALTWRGLADTRKALGHHDAAYRALEHALNTYAISVTPDATPKRRAAKGVSTT
jgi:tetratricopeptide (TPR) repeat protein